MNDEAEQIKYNIYQKLNNVREAVKYLQKDATVQGYKAITHDMVTAEVRPHLIGEGVIVIPSVTSHSVTDTGTVTQSGTPIIRFEGCYTVKFINIDDPQDSVEMTVIAHANDQGDKAPGKALSYATKYALLKILSIETGETDEGRIEGKARTYSPHQKEIFYELIEADDSLGLRLFFEKLEPETITALFNTFPKGDKTKMKENIRKMESIGTDLYTNIKDAVKENDYNLYRENIEGASTATRKALRARFAAVDIPTLDGFIKMERDENQVQTN